MNICLRSRQANRAFIGRHESPATNMKANCTKRLLNLAVFILLNISFWAILVRGPILSYIRDETIFVEDILPTREGKTSNFLHLYTYWTVNFPHSAPSLILCRVDPMMQKYLRAKDFAPREATMMEVVMMETLKNENMQAESIFYT